MAIVEPLRVCLICKEMLYDGLCPNGHSPDNPKKEEWPSWIKKPITFTKQRRDAAAVADKIDDKELRIKETLSQNSDINLAMRLSDDQEVLDVLNDCALFLQNALIHKRKAETLSRISRVTEHMAKMAEATSNYVKYCKTIRIPE